VHFPLFLNIESAPTLVVGAGAIARHKAESLIACGAIVTMVALEACEEVLKLASEGRVQFLQREFRPEDVDGMRLVIAATDDVNVNEVVMRRCRELGVWVNVVDDPARCDFYVPAVVQRGRVQVAISTEGASPALSRRLKEEISGVLEPTLGAYADLVAEARDRIKEMLVGEAYEVRRLANEAVLGSGARELLKAGDEAGARRVVEEVLASIERRKVAR
jgi:siroheme synthase-like protein